MDSAKAAIEVTAGLLPMQPINELTRRWWISSLEYEEARAKNNDPANRELGVGGLDFLGQLMTDKQGPALAYAQLLMLQPDRYNFVRMDWIWF